MEVIQHELVVMLESLPIKIYKRVFNKSNIGCEFHWHEQLEFYYVVTGGVKLLCNSETNWINSGETAFINWCEPHKSLEFKDNTLFYVIQIDLASIAGENETINNFFNLLKSNCNKIPLKIINNDLIYNCFTNLINEYIIKQQGYQLIILSEIIKILALIIRYNIDSNSKVNQLNLKLINKIFLFISSNYNKNFKLSNLADKLGISVQYMCKIFKQHTGTTIIKFINDVRCSRANSLILKGHSITGAALSVGYNDVNYFSRVYKKIYGKSPSNFIKENYVH